MITLRGIRMRVKALWLVYLIRQHTKKVRAFKAKVEEHMAKHSSVLDETDMYLLSQLKRVQEQDSRLWAKAKDLGVTR